MASFNWTCTHCNHPQVASDHNTHGVSRGIAIGKNAIGDSLGFRVYALACQNKDCAKVTLSMTFGTDGKWVGDDWFLGKQTHYWKLLPESDAKPQPDYIPKPLRDDYFEACRIRDLSPKASATLARRCLQGMIRDFAGISKPTLDAEIKALAKLVEEDKAPRGVSPESVEAIDNVRKIGNIGAHMEKDINLIIDIDPKEAQILIQLVETLFEEWYVAKHERALRFKKVADLRADKDAKKNGDGAAGA